MRGRPGALAAALVALALAAPAARADSPPASGGLARARVEDAMPRGPSIEERLEEIRRRIQAALVYPPLARWRDQTGEAMVRFEIGSDGRARNVELMRSTGRALLDAAALRAVTDAGVLPRVYLPLEVPVRFALDAVP